MIHKFSAENFYSIGDKVSVNLESSYKDTDNCELYLHPDIDNGRQAVAKICLVGGANASGKTNVLRALAYFKYLMVDSAVFSAISGATGMNICQFAPYEGTKPTVLSVDFSTNDSLYSYTVKLNNQRILTEKLSRRRLVNERSTSRIVMSRHYNDTGYDVVIDKSLSSIRQLTTSSELLNNNPCAGMVAILSNFDQDGGMLKEVHQYWRNVTSNIQMFGSYETNHSMANLSIGSLRHIMDDQQLSDAVVSVLRKFDLGFEKFNVVDKVDEVTGEHGRSYYMQHHYGNTSISLTMNYESSGTQRLIILLETILGALSHPGGVAIVDELDAYLHPDAFDEIINMIVSPNINTNHAQLIFSTQNYTVMSQLHKDQIVLTGKNEAGQTEAWRLDELKGVESRDNYYHKYLTGAYGGVPEIG